MTTILFIIMYVSIKLLSRALEKERAKLRATGELPPLMKDSLLNLYLIHRKHKLTEQASRQALRAAQTAAYLASAQAHPGHR